MNPSRSETPAVEFDPRADYFEVFGLERRFDLDAEDIERRYLSLAAAVHPDRFAGKPSGERRMSMERSAALNEAYRALRDPVRRAEYLCKLGGIDLDSSDPTHGAPSMDQAFLMDMIERRETLAEKKQAGPTALDAYREDVEDEMDAAFDEAVAGLQRSSFAAAAEALVKRRYLQRLVDEIDEMDAAS